jgi:hypothetical protein
MRVSSAWRTGGLLAGALLVGSVIGTPLAQAVSAGLVRIEGGHNSNLAVVSKTGQLSVNAGLTTTPAGQVKAALASPADSVAVFSGIGSSFCTAGGFYKVPAGKALIITGATVNNAAVSAGGDQLALEAGPSATPCTNLLAGAASPSSEDLTSQNQVFSPGIPVPAGDALGLQSTNDDGSAFIYGYLVPAAAVPPGILASTHERAGMVAIEASPNR